VIGGGDTAIDAARVARRTGAEVTILYRRTRVEMPAIDTEVEDAFKEDVKIEFLVLPVGIVRNGDALEAIKVQRMELGEPDSSGRRRPVPIEGTEYTIAVDTIIAAISQEPDWDPIPELGPKKRWLEADENYKVKENAGDVDNVWTGGDALDLGIATTAVLHGRLAATDMHAALQNAERPHFAKEPPIPLERIKLEHYDPKEKATPSHRPVEEWLSKPDDEITQAISQDQFLDEAGRCFSCGLCMGCEKCWMYCTPSCFIKVPTITHGNYYTIRLEVCDGCKKCADECPCGYLDMI
jgi:ferredoxin